MRPSTDIVDWVRVAIMQPYFYPYVGYFQLISAADVFVIADCYQYTKQSWINRNRLILDEQINYFGIPIQNHSSQSLISDINIAEPFSPDKLFARIKNNYSRTEGWELFAPFFSNVLYTSNLKLIEKINLSLEINMELMGITTKKLRLSDIQLTSEVSGQERVIAICQALGAKEYLNLPGGMNMYSKEVFARNGLSLSFLEPNLISYEQTMDGFISHLSILDLAFSVGLDRLRNIHLPSFSIVQ